MSFKQLMERSGEITRLVIPDRNSWEQFCVWRWLFFIRHMRAAIEQVGVIELWSERYIRDSSGPTFSLECPANMSEQQWRHQGLTIEAIMCHIYGKSAESYSPVVATEPTLHENAPWDDMNGAHPHAAEGGIAGGEFSWPEYNYWRGPLSSEARD